MVDSVIMEERTKKFLAIFFISLFGIFLLVVIFADKESTSFSHYLTSKHKLDKLAQIHVHHTNGETNSNNKSQVKRDLAQVTSEKPQRRRIDPKPLNGRGESRQASPQETYPDHEYDIHRDGLTLKYNLHAISKENFDPSEFKLIEERPGFYIVESENNSPKDALAVVMVEGSKALAIFTGIVKIKFNNMEVAPDIVDEYNGEVNAEYAHINRILIRFDSFTETMDAYESLKQNEFVDDVEVELLQYARVAK